MMVHQRSKHQNERAPERTDTDFRVQAEAAELNNDCFFGVMRKSVLLSITSVPKEIPFDYMHLALEGKLKRKLSQSFLCNGGFINRRDLEDINIFVKNVKVPHDFSKKPIILSEKSVKKAKAGELQLHLLHVLLPLLKAYVPVDIFCHFGLFITAIQLLNKDSVQETDILCAESMLLEYHRLNEHLYGENAQTFTNHALTHLALQRREHGCPLVLLSNFVFEGFIASIKKQYHGTRGIVPQMVRNIGLVQNLNEICKEIPDPRIRELSERICQRRKTKKMEVGDELFLLGNILNAQPVLDNVDLPDLDDITEQTLFCERIVLRGITYHSLAYRFRRSSNSYTIAYFSDGIRYGEVIFYFLNNGVCYMLVRILEKTDEVLYTHDMIGSLSDTIDDFISHGQLGQGFIPVKVSDEFQMLPTRCIKNRMIFVPCRDRGYLSYVLNSYQRD